MLAIWDVWIIDWMSALTLNPKALKSMVEGSDILNLTAQFSGFETENKQTLKFKCIFMSAEQWFSTFLLSRP
jgi:hypothetical protein